MDFSMHSSCNALWDCFLHKQYCGLRIWPVDILKGIFFRTVSMMPKHASHRGSSLGFRKEPISVSFGRQMKADAGRHAGEMRAQSKQSEQNTQITSISQCVRCRKVNIPIPYLVYVSPTPASESWQRQEQKWVNKSMHTSLFSNSPVDDYPQYI